jgi:hypothetical protein
MKEAPLSAAAAHQQRQDQLRRDRAAAQTVRVVFPELSLIRLDLHFEPASATTPVPQSHLLHPPARAFFEFRCPFADCNGEFDLSSAVANAVGSASHRAEGILVCNGRRPRNPAEKEPCGLQMRFAVTVECHEDARTASMT